MSVGDVAPEKQVCPTHGCYFVITETGTACPRCGHFYAKLRYPPMPSVQDEPMPNDWRNCDHCQLVQGVTCKETRRKVRVQCRTNFTRKTELKE